MQLPIPDDLNPEVCEFVICLPKDEQWLALLRGFLDLPSKGRVWDASTGTIIDAQAVGKMLRDYNLDIENKEVFVACTSETQFNNLIIELQNIVTQLSQIDVNVSQQVSLQATANSISRAAASAFAFSTSEAVAFVNADIFVSLPEAPPEEIEDVSEGTGQSTSGPSRSGVSNTVISRDIGNPGSASDIACQVAYYIVDWISDYVQRYQLVVVGNSYIPPYRLAIELGAIVKSLVEQIPEWPLILPRPVLWAIALLTAAYENDRDLTTEIQEVADYLIDDRTGLAQELYCGRSLGESAYQIAARMRAYINLNVPPNVTIEGTQFQLNLLTILFGATVSATVIFERLNWTPPASNTEIGGCFDCGS